jgi:DNA end-binding protein Ku
MPQAVWVGNLSFGLVNIPIKLHTATSPKRVRFHQYEAGTGRRIRYRRVAEGPAPGDVPPPSDRIRAEPPPRVSAPERAETYEPPHWSGPTEAEETGEDAEETGEDAEETGEDAEVPWEEIIRGYEVEPGRVVTVDSDELESVAPERSRVLEVEQFVDLQDIDPVFFEKSYYVVPQSSDASQRPYWLLYRAMEEAGKVAIGRFVMRTKEYLVAVRPAEHVLMLQTLFYADEVRDPKEAWISSIEEPTERELRLARQLLDSLQGDWEPSRHRDEHRERLLELIHSKLEEAVVVPDTGEEAPMAPVSDLLEALQASIQAAKEAREVEGRQTG